MSIRRSVVGAALAAVATATGLCAAPAATAAPPIPGGLGERTIADNLSVPWGIAFLPDGAALVTERNTGRILQVKDGQVTEVQRIADSVAYGTDGGLLGIAVSPDYAQDGWIFVFYTTNTDNRIARFKLGQQPQPLVTGIKRGLYRNGGALAFGPDGMLYAGVGDAYNYNASQNVHAFNGKILRMTKDGKPAAGNPFANSLVWSYGHRNVLGMTWDEAGTMYATEVGESTWDEVNVIKPGANYGWSKCEGYCEQPDGSVEPIVVMYPEECVPAGVAHRNGMLYVSCLRGERLVRVSVQNGKSHGDVSDVYTSHHGRLRAAVNAPDGTLWVSTSNRDGRSTVVRNDDDRVISLNAI
ncbi:hypothetical protein GCM10012275_43900 [Longimycelium tulufanense]|uniref:Glucose/Sorbosone dehydrogenase domain-containing protein n=1 Tax=Longimycelium tulufanense TaxID=907463 RepID=A0A8J3CHL2_9PSEU|nr:PQQ-dependent sugar dehydrogenase [Longimycelium tulufanense]GGM68648.1 hypothetical protein GCM10012275_43900 [Longimycelium tulufanense]